MEDTDDVDDSRLDFRCHDVSRVKIKGHTFDATAAFTTASPTPGDSPTVSPTPGDSPTITPILGDVPTIAPVTVSPARSYGDDEMYDYLHQYAEGLVMTELLYYRGDSLKTHKIKFFTLKRSL